MISHLISPSTNGLHNMNDTAALRRKLKIHTGVVKRLNKEQVLYTKESEDQKTKLDKFIAGKAEDWDIKNAVCFLSVAS